VASTEVNLGHFLVEHRGVTVKIRGWP